MHEGQERQMPRAIVYSFIRLMRVNLVHKTGILTRIISETHKDDRIYAGTGCGVKRSGADDNLHLRPQRQHPNQDARQQFYDLYLGCKESFPCVTNSGLSS